MRYYHYEYKNNNNFTEENDLRASGSICIKEKTKDTRGSLIIEEDTVYEIDEECIKCRR